MRKVIKTRQAYTVSEVAETLKQQAGLPFAPQIMKVFWQKIIFLSGGEWRELIQITVKKDKIIVTHSEKPVKGEIDGVTLPGSIGGAMRDALSAAGDPSAPPDEWCVMLGKTVCDAKDIVLLVADKVQSLFGQ